MTEKTKWTRVLVRQMLAGDAALVRVFVAEMGGVIHCHAAPLLRWRGAPGGFVRQELEDIVQQVFEALFANGGHKLLQWDHALGNGLPNFVGQIARNEVLSLLRSRRRSPLRGDLPLGEEHLQAVSGALGPEAEAASRELLLMVLDSLKERLSAELWRTFELLYIERREAEEVCQVLLLSADNLYQRRTRVLKTIREITGELMSEGGEPARNPLQKKTKP